MTLSPGRKKIKMKKTTMTMRLMRGLVLMMALLMVGAPGGTVSALPSEQRAGQLPTQGDDQAAGVGEATVTVAVGSHLGRRFVPTASAGNTNELHAAAAPSYDPTSAYDQKGVNAPRGFSALAPNELIDPFSGNLILHQVDLTLPGVGGLD